LLWAEVNVNPMNDPLYLFTPDELIQADRQIKLLQLELKHNAQGEPFGGESEPELVINFMDNIHALDDIQKNVWEFSVYDLIGRPSFRPASELTDAEIPLALSTLRHQLNERGITLEILAPDDYTDRTIYCFVTNELLPYEIPNVDGEWETNFVYEEFYPNARYDIIRQGNKLLDSLKNGGLEKLSNCLAEQYLDRQTIPTYSVRVRPEVIDHLTELIEGWWPRTLRGGSVNNVLIADDTETAQATLELHMGLEGDTNHLLKEGLVFLVRYDLWWVIDRIEIDGWVLK
jgi:hypothetical protein